MLLQVMIKNIHMMSKVLGLIIYIHSINTKKVGTKGNQNGRLLKVVPTSGNNISQSNNTVNPVHLLNIL